MIVLIGLLVGFSLGLTGAGGAVFAVPLLLLMASLPISEAIGLALGAIALGSGIGAFVYWRHDRLLWLPALSFSAGGLLTAPIGKLMGNQLPENILLLGFSILAVLIALKMWRASFRQLSIDRLFPDASDAQKTKLRCHFSESGQLELKPRCLSAMVAGGLGVGLLSGLFGVGGGFLIVPLIIYQTGVVLSLAVGASLFSVAVISGSGFITYLVSDGDISHVIAEMGLGVVFGIIAGALLAPHVNSALLQRGFALSLLLVVTVTVLKFYLSGVAGEELNDVVASVI